MYLWSRLSVMNHLMVAAVRFVDGMSWGHRLLSNDCPQLVAVSEGIADDAGELAGNLDSQWANGGCSSSPLPAVLHALPFQPRGGSISSWLHSCHSCGVSSMSLWGSRKSPDQKRLNSSAQARQKGGRPLLLHPRIAPLLMRATRG